LGVNAALLGGACQIEGVGGGGDENGGAVVLKHRQLVINVQRVFGDDRRLDEFGPPHVAHRAGLRQPAQGNKYDIVGGDAARRELPGDQPAPVGQGVAGVAEHQRFAVRAQSRVQADYLAQRKGEHAVGKTLHHIFLRGEGQPVQVAQGLKAEIPQLLAVAADVAAQPGKQRLEALKLHLLQLEAGNLFVAAIKRAHGRRQLQRTFQPLPR